MSLNGVSSRSFRLGASIADGLAKPKSVSDLGLGNGPVGLVLGVLIVALVAYLAISRVDANLNPSRHER
jgi:uncharacterized membrane-anchored protein